MSVRVCLPKICKARARKIPLLLLQLLQLDCDN